MPVEETKNLVILDQYGRPYEQKSEIKEPRKKGLDPLYPDDRSILASYSSYVGGIYSLDASALVRSLEPFMTHAWVFAGAMAIARNLSQAPFTLYRETRQTVQKREIVARDMNRPWMGPKTGKHRSAVRRHLMSRDREQGVAIKGLTEDPESPWQPVFDKPNFLMTADQFWMAHWIWMIIRGEVFWVYSMDSGEPYMPGDIPDQIFPMSPDLFRPIYSGNLIVAWQMRTPLGYGGGAAGRIQTLLPEEVNHFRYFNPRDLLRGLSPLTASAGGINLDLMSIDGDRALMINGAEPRGVLMVDKGYEFEDDKKKAEFERGWNQRHRGEKNAGRTAILEGMKYLPTSLSPRDMEHLKMRQWNREEQLGVMGVPGTAVGITDKVNRATAKTIDRNFWEKTLIPTARHTEAAIDGTLFFHEKDSVVGAFDFTKVDALREGIDDKINSAKSLAGTELHCPPRIAYQVVGLSVPEYDGDEEIVIAASGITTLSEHQESVRARQDGVNPDGINFPVDDPSKPADVQNFPKPPAAPPGGGGGDGSNPTGAPPGTPDSGDDGDAIITPPSDKKFELLNLQIRRQKKLTEWQNITKGLQSPLEDRFARGWKNFLRKERQITLARYDELLAEGGKISVNSVLSVLDDSRDLLKSIMSPIYDRGRDDVYSWTEDEFGGSVSVPVDDGRITRMISAKRSLLLDSAPRVLKKRLREALVHGIADKISRGALRRAISDVYDRAAEPGRVLTIARTESSGVMNTIRRVIFSEEDVPRVEWLTAEDEFVRTNHQIYGDAGPKKMGFNWMSLSKDESGGGSLLFPGDPDGPANEIISCRCVLGPRKK